MKDKHIIYHKNAFLSKQGDDDGDSLGFRYVSWMGSGFYWEALDLQGDLS